MHPAPTSSPGDDEPAHLALDAEWAALDSVVPRSAISSRGPREAAAVVVVQPHGPDVLSPEASDALEKGFAALGLDWRRFRVVPAMRGADEPRIGWARILAWETEIVDPDTVLVLGPDAEAIARQAWPKRGSAAASASGSTLAELPWRALGRPIHVLPDPETSLASPKGKRALWAALKRAAPGLRSELDN